MPEASLVESELNDVKKLMQAGKFAEAENHLLAMIAKHQRMATHFICLQYAQRYQKKYSKLWIR